MTKLSGSDAKSTLYCSFCGKSHVGRLLAARLGLAFVDIDVRIEADAGLSIPAIFANEGEAGFRLRESRLLADALAQPGQVIATGGGAVLDTCLLYTSRCV